MRIIRHAAATWAGAVSEGEGTMQLGRDGQSLPFSLKSRTEDAAGTNPEELLGAAHAGCFSMSLANLLEENGTPGSVRTEAKVTMEEVSGSFSITKVDLTVTGHVTGIEQDAFLALADDAKRTCPVSRLFSSAEIVLHASLN